MNIYVVGENVALHMNTHEKTVEYIDTHFGAFTGVHKHVLRLSDFDVNMIMLGYKRNGYELIEKGVTE